MTHPPGSHRVRPTAYPLLDLARQAVHGHKMIAERVAEAAAHSRAERDARAATAAAVRAAQAATQLEAHSGTPAVPES